MPNEEARRPDRGGNRGISAKSETAEIFLF